MENCVFCKIANGILPAMKVYEDEYTLTFMDYAKDVDGHVLVIPKKHCKNILDCEDDALSATIHSVAKAKANAAQAIPELIEIATNISFQDNSDEKHKADAKFGWYRCTVRFSIPTCDDKGNRVGSNNYQGRMIIRCGADGKKYLYDIIDIKKET